MDVVHHICKLTVQILSQTSSSSEYKRNLTVFEYIHIKREIDYNIKSLMILHIFTTICG